MEQDCVVNTEEQEPSQTLREQQNRENAVGEKSLFGKDMILQISITILGTILGVMFTYFGTKLYDDAQDKEKLISQLKSSISINNMTMKTIDVRMESAKQYIDENSKNSYGDDVLVEDFSIYEPISYFDYSDSLFKDSTLYKELTETTRERLPIISANNRNSISYYDIKKNDYYNYLALKHLKNSLEWQGQQLQYELNYQEKKQNNINLSEIKSKYEGDFENIENEWKDYTEKKKAMHRVTVN
ncbi:hypothetical protein CN417_19550 [Bacillus thuringiensis]|uniref:hypothetical protein n=1 Tax=Bacillus thuringiensis TaxID=1428 RepID=UPI000BF7E5B7|nr:hypothetical protein [Bacillus thuringiensis]PEV06031.1 hypothetical protein CN417_19550 [Bacillus thuringiensis]